MAELALTLVTAPKAEPISRKEGKNHLRVDNDFTDDDSLISALIVSARQHAEAFLRRQLINATYELRLDAFPTQIILPRPPLQSITHIKYIDTDGAEQTLATDQYTVDTESTVGRVVPAYNVTWPSTRAEIHAVRVTYVAGYGTQRESVPSDINAAIKLILGHLYEHRENVLVGVSANKLPAGAESLLWPHRIMGEY